MGCAKQCYSKEHSYLKGRHFRIKSLWTSGGPLKVKEVEKK